MSRLSLIPLLLLSNLFPSENQFATIYGKLPRGPRIFHNLGKYIKDTLQFEVSESRCRKGRKLVLSCQRLLLLVPVFQA